MPLLLSAPGSTLSATLSRIYSLLQTRLQCLPFSSSPPPPLLLLSVKLWERIDGAVQVNKAYTRRPRGLIKPGLKWPISKNQKATSLLTIGWNVAHYFDTLLHDKTAPSRAHCLLYFFFCFRGLLDIFKVASIFLRYPLSFSFQRPPLNFFCVLLSFSYTLCHRVLALLCHLSDPKTTLVVFFLARSHGTLAPEYLFNSRFSALLVLNTTFTAFDGHCFSCLQYPLSSFLFSVFALSQPSQCIIPEVFVVTAFKSPLAANCCFLQIPILQLCLSSPPSQHIIHHTFT